MNRKTRLGRTLSLSSALVLAISFFLPAVRLRHGEVRTPAVEVYRTVVHPEPGWDVFATEQGSFLFCRERPVPHLTSLGVFLVPWATGVLIPLRLWLIRNGRERAAHAWLFGWLLGVFILFELGAVSAFMTSVEYRGFAALYRKDLYVAISPLPLVAGFIALRQRVRGHATAALLCQLITCGGMTIFYVLGRIYMPDIGIAPKYGITVVVIAAMALLIPGSILEWLGRDPQAAR